MARGVSAEETLGEVVRMVANEMVAEVCSIYLLRAGEVLELFATQGLNPDAVHRTRLRVGEGLVGDIAAHARPLTLDDAQSHPQFAYRPETGEEIYHSLAGVPIVRSGRCARCAGGAEPHAPAVRRGGDRDSADHRHVLAEMVSAGHFVSPTRSSRSTASACCLAYRWRQLTPGVAIGRAVLHEPRIMIQRGCRRRRGAETKRFEEALARRARRRRPHARGRGHAVGRASRDPRDLPHVRRRPRLDRARARGDRLGLTAEAGVQRAFDDVRTARPSTDPYIRERLSDLQDLTNRLLLRLTGRSGPIEQPA
jgi:phosphotransferase system enzyme I (PtsP)